MKAFKRRREAKLDYAERSFRRKLYWKYPWLGKDWWVSSNRNCMSDWNVAYNINPATKGEELKYGDVNLWFVDKISVRQYFNIRAGTYTSLKSKAFDFKYVDSYDSREESRDSYRQEVLGIRGTIEELAKHFGKTVSCINDRKSKGMSLEEALTAPIIRLKYVTINGDRKTLKAWYKYFNLPDGKVRSWRDNHKGVTFTQTLENFGVNTSELVILEG